MKNLTVRERLLGSAAAGVCGALAVVAFPTAAAAQTTTCSQTGTSVSCVDGATPIASGFVDATTVVASGPGFVATDPDTVTVTLVPAGNFCGLTDPVSYLMRASLADQLPSRVARTLGGWPGCRRASAFRRPDHPTRTSASGRSATFAVVSLIEADFDTRRSPRRRGRAAFVTHLATNELGGDLSQSGPRGRELTAGDRTAKASESARHGVLPCASQRWPGARKCGPHRLMVFCWPINVRNRAGQLGVS